MLYGMAKRDDVLATLDRVWDTQGALFATFEAAEDEDAFVQYIDGMLHVRWPFEDEVDDLLDEIELDLPEQAFIASEDVGHSLEIAVGDVLAPEIADFIVALFDRLLAPECEVLSSVEQGR